MVLFIVLLVIVFILVVIGLIFLFRKRKKKRLFESLGMSLFLVRMPKYEKKEEKEKQDIKSMVGKMEQIYSTFLYLKKERKFATPPRVVFEIASEVGGEDISFYVAVPSFQESAL